MENDTQASHNQDEQSEHDPLQGKVFSQVFHDSVFPTLKKSTKTTLCDIRWQIDLNHQWFSIFQALIQTDCRHLSIQNIKQVQRLVEQKPTHDIRPYMHYLPIKCISHIKFNDLKKLDISRLQLQSIESLSFLDMQKLSLLNLTANRISCLKPLNKLKWPKLAFLDLKRNVLKNADLSRAGMAKLQDLKLTLFNDGEIIEHCSGVYVKIESKTCQPHPDIMYRLKIGPKKQSRLYKAFLEKAKSTDDD